MFKNLANSKISVNSKAAVMPTIYVYSTYYIVTCIHIRGLSALLVSDGWAMREPLNVERAIS